jgi:hypothetical protein
LRRARLETRLALALGLLAALALTTVLGAGQAWAWAPRLGTGLIAATGLALWARRARARGGVPGLADAPRLVVVERVGLSPRTGLALVEVDGRTYVVVHGDGFARLCPAPRSDALAHRGPRLEVAR